MYIYGLHVVCCVTIWTQLVIAVGYCYHLLCKNSYINQQYNI